MNPRKPAKTGNGAIKFPWQSNGSKGSPLPSQPKRSSPAQAVSIATGEALRHSLPHALSALRFGLAGSCNAHEMCRPLGAPCLHVATILKAMQGPCQLCIARCQQPSEVLSLPHAEPATRQGQQEARALARQAKESEEFLRRRGSEAPAVIALGFLSAAASALAPLVMVSPLGDLMSPEASCQSHSSSQMAEYGVMTVPNCLHVLTLLP